jgi:hypothetical protein
MAKTPKPASPITGRWRIDSMSAWDEDYINEEEEGYFEFDARGGEFHFGSVHGRMDCRLTTRDGKPDVEWTGGGNDEVGPEDSVERQETARDDPWAVSLPWRGSDGISVSCLSCPQIGPSPAARWRPRRGASP